MKRRADRRTMIHIGDADFFGALKRTGAGLKPTLAAAERGDYTAAWQSLAEHFTSRRRSCPVSQYARRVAELDPDGPEARDILSAAQKLVRHDITGWHSTTFRFGKDIDFNAEFGQSGVYGFHYMGWLPPIGEAYVLTADGTYAAAFDDIFSQWYEQRDRVEFRIPHLDPIWYELGCGTRSQVFMWLYHVLRRAPELRLETVARLWKTFLGHGRWLMEHERKDCRRANWQVTGCRALMLLGLFFPEFREAGAWVRLGRKRLMEHCERDFFNDGCYSERCPGYGTIALRFMPELYDLLAGVNGAASDRQKLRKRMKEAFRWYMLTSTPIGTSPATGDSGHGGISDLMKEGARRTGDGALLWPARHALSTSERRSLPRPVRPPQTSLNLPSSGFAVMRSGWERNDHYMIINYGPYGGGHTHNHALDFELFAYGAGLALDTSRFDSYDNPLDAYFRCARAHNQVVVNDADMDRAGLKVTGVLWRSGKHVDLFAATHNGYAESHGVTISRKVVFVKPHCWLVSDLIEERVRHHCYTWFLHSPERFRPTRGKAFLAGRGPGLLVVPARPEEVRHVRKGVGYTDSDRRTPNIFPERNWIGYEKFDHLSSFATFCVALVPFRNAPATVSLRPLSVTDRGGQVSRREAEAFELTVGGRRYVIALSHSDPAKRQYGPVRCGHKLGVFEARGERWISLAPAQ